VGTVAVVWLFSATASGQESPARPNFLPREKGIGAGLHFQKGNQLYQQGQYLEAAQEYEQVLSLGFESGELYFNLGNAYFKARELGRAILNYERAKRLLPRDEDVDYNLQIANLSVVDKITVPPPFLPLKVFSDFKGQFGVNSWALFTLGCYTAVIGLISVRVLLPRPAVRRFTTATILPLVLFLILSSLTFAARVREAQATEAILLADKVDVQSAPGGEGTTVFSLHEGVKVRVEETSGEWVEIRLADGKVGWIKTADLERI